MGSAASYQKQVDETMRELLSKGGLVNPSARDEFLAACAGVYEKIVEDHTREFTIRASKIGQPICQQQFEKLGAVPEPDTTCPLLKFQFGNMIEGLVMIILRHAGLNIEEVQTPVEVEISGMRIPGTLDLVIDGKVWDIKSASPYTFSNKFRDFQSLVADDPFGYIAQLYLYAEAKKMPVGGWIVVNKVSGEIRFIEPPRIDAIYKHQALNKVRTNLAILAQTKTQDDLVRAYQLEDETYYKKKTGKKTLCMTCTYCNFKQQCWDYKIQLLPSEASTAKNKPMKWYYQDV